jgi:hypothetical protein
MKWTALLFAGIVMIITSCGSDTPKRGFELIISSDRGATELLYILSEKSLNVYRISSDSFTNDTAFIFQSALNYTDTLSKIALLDVKAFSCSEQHALDASYVKFINDSTNVNVDPYVNHPVELDYAVRLINSIVDEELQLTFLDMQGAIEQTDKHSM